MSTVVAAPPTTVHVLYGSETGNAEFLCDDAVEALADHGIHAASAPLDDIPAPQLATLGTALIIVSTTGDGDMPYGADTFWDRLDADDAPDCTGLRYAVLALGDSTYTYFCEAGTRIDARLAELGATRIADRVDCDAAYDARAGAWITERVAQLETLLDGDAGGAAAAPASVEDAPDDADDGWDPKDWGPGLLDDTRDRPTVFGGTTAPRTTPATSPVATVRSPWTREHPYLARLAGRSRLSAGDHEVIQVELDLGDSGITLQPGDSLGIIASNDAYAVARFLQAAGLDDAQRAGDTTAGALAQDVWELRFPSAALLDAVGRRAPGTAVGALVATGDRAGLDDWVRTHTVADLLAMLPRPLAAGDLAALMRPIRARAYSAASSTLAYPTSVHLLVAVERPMAATMRSGVASGQLADRLAVGETVPVFPLPNRSFRLPEDPSAPIVMVGPGVGVAPFRAFLQQRSMQPGAGPAWLFFGGRHAAADFLCHDDWQAMRDAGVLTRIDTAFSRDQPQKVYVQHRLREHAAELAQWLQDGAYWYVCGDARQMAGDVESALRGILAAQLGEDAGAALFARLHDEKRYRIDVY